MAIYNKYQGKYTLQRRPLVKEQIILPRNDDKLLSNVQKCPIWMRCNNLAQYSTTLRQLKFISKDETSQLLQLKSKGRNLTLLSKGTQRNTKSKSIRNYIQIRSDVSPPTIGPCLDSIITYRVYK